jgi:PAS domain S-box-containing protein
LVQELVKLHGGAVTIESAVGKGTTVRVSLPFGTAHLPKDRIGAERSATSTALHADTYVEEALRWLAPDLPEAAAHEDLSMELRSGPSKRNHVLVADDNADMREYVRRLLATRYDVTTVANGSEALNAALADPPDLVLTDVMMPVVDGFELLKRIRADERTKTLPIILLSARAGEESRIEGLDYGADDYLVKPFSARELLARVDAHISLARMRKEAAEALRLSEMRLGLVLESANMVAWEWNPIQDHVVASGDIRRIFGTDLRSSREGLALVHPEDQAKHKPLVESVGREGGSYFSEFRIQRADTGETAWLEERATAITDETGKVTRVVGVLTDITQRKVAEEDFRRRNAELERANSELEEFAYAASHDLQEPLRTVNIYTDLLLRKAGLQQNEQVSEFAAFIHEGVKHMELLISDLLAYARVVHHEQDPARPIVLARPLEHALDSLRGLILETGAEITYDCANAVVSGDERQLTQVFQNVVANALKYRRRDTPPRVSVCARRADSEWLVSVKDNGIGFEPQYAERIFGLFKRLHKTEYPGTGLGLAICKRIVERYGGRVWASSEGEGKGATFSFAFSAVDV